MGAEGIQELIHESFYAKLYRDHSPNAMILESGLGTMQKDLSRHIPWSGHPIIVVILRT
jgi:hypothetical protein